MPVRRTAPFATATLATAVLAMLLTSCSTTAAPATPTTSSSSSPTEGGQDMPLQSVYDAVGASDPRIDRASTVSAYQSGPTKIMSVVVRVTGSGAISTDTLENVLRAARDSAPEGVGGVELLARDAADPDRLLDLEPAAQGLPDGVDYVWVDGGLTMLSNALAAL